MNEEVKDSSTDQSSANSEEAEVETQESESSEQEISQQTDESVQADESTEKAEESSAEGEKKTFTQEELDKIVSERLGRQETKLRRELKRSAELQANSKTTVDDSVIYDPLTGMPLNEDDERYKAIKTQRDMQQAIDYNNQLLAQQSQFEKIQREEQKIFLDVQNIFEDQCDDLRYNDVDAFNLLNKENLMQKQQCFGMVQAASDNPHGVRILANLIKDDYKEALRISNLPYSKQLLEMTKLIQLKAKGTGDPIVKSNAPPPVESFGSGIGTAVNKDPEEMSFDELYEATRERNKFLF